jgi:hypothetical protein
VTWPIKIIHNVRNSACPVNIGVDLSRLIRPDLRASSVWLLRLGCAQIGYLSGCRWVIGHAERSSRSQSGESGGLITLGGVPVDEVAAGDLWAGDVVRLEDPEAQCVDRVVLVDGRVRVALRPVGLDVPRRSAGHAGGG